MNKKEKKIQEIPDLSSHPNSNSKVVDRRNGGSIVRKDADGGIGKETRVS